VVRIELTGPVNFEAMASLWFRANGGSAALAGATFDETLALFRARCDFSDAWFAVGRHDGCIASIAHGMNAREDGGIGVPITGLFHLSMIAVEPAYRRRGFARQMTAFAIERAAIDGYETIQLWTGVENVAASRLYESFGFRTSGQESCNRYGARARRYVANINASGTY
jgi:ribosomal protein S18 acetylase RimI-like enzyme